MFCSRVLPINSVVMRGLDPRIHSSAYAGIDMDCRVKPGNDSE